MHVLNIKTRCLNVCLFTSTFRTSRQLYTARLKSNMSTPGLVADTACSFLCEGLGKSKIAVKNNVEIIGGNYIFIVNNIYMS